MTQTEFGRCSQQTGIMSEEPKSETGLKTGFCYLTTGYFFGGNEADMYMVAYP
jgi:hypothetical protein